MMTRVFVRIVLAMLLSMTIVLPAATHAANAQGCPANRCR